MEKQNIKKKYVFLGDINSINIELIFKSFSFLKNKVYYVILCNKKDISNNHLKTGLKINEILDSIKLLTIIRVV